MSLPPPDGKPVLASADAAAAAQLLEQAMDQVENAIVGKRSTIKLLMVALLARGHVLIEDIPGVGKTTLARAFAGVIGGSFKRLQFTPDLLPGDVTGLTIFNQRSGEFSFSPGPIFANVVLADEINRATPKTQSALLEAMGEAQVTTEGISRALPRPFIVVATQNPVEYHGTYPLPEAQLDRFLLRVRLGYPEGPEEVEMLVRHAAAAGIEDVASGMAPQELLASVGQVLSDEQAVALQRLSARVYISPSAQEYIVAVMAKTRDHPRIALGGSPRASVALQRAAKAWALMAGREYVVPDDIKAMTIHVLTHRIISQGGAGLGGTGQIAEELLVDLVRDVPVPGVP